MYQLVNGEVTISKLRRVELQDLLGRDPIQVNLEEICGYINDKTVLVTGGGGSIGSELCRQIARHRPRRLVIFDIYENNAYDIQMELRREHPELTLDVCIGSVRDRRRVNDLLDTYQPDLIFHAAAHKHVPLMEDSPNEAIKNNVFGTYNMAQSAAAHGVKRFVLISTDKAVNPTNIMGASKRLCEMVVQMMDRRSDTEFVAVRFGNVLGSNGSVVPLFERQIACGGPVTVTHPEITRFFMTIPEAVSLVLQAGYYARGGEIFVLDMGQPVKIDDMARQLIRLSGFEPDVDIPIIYTGLRPGEKLYEELLMDEEGLQDTANRLIHVGRPIDMDDEAFCRQLEVLERACRHNSPDIRGAFIPQNRKWPSFPAGGRSGPSTGGAWGTHHRPPGPPGPCPAGSAHGTGSPGPRSYGIPPRPGRRECPRLRRKSPGSPADMPTSPRRQPGTGPECSASCRSPLTGRHTAGSGPGS